MYATQAYPLMLCWVPCGVTGEMLCQSRCQTVGCRATSPHHVHMSTHTTQVHHVTSADLLPAVLGSIAVIRGQGTLPSLSRHLQASRRPCWGTQPTSRSCPGGAVVIIVVIIVKQAPHCSTGGLQVH
jgi:hypothetical protein